jgi:hypothetical protein
MSLRFLVLLPLSHMQEGAASSLSLSRMQKQKLPLLSLGYKSNTAVATSLTHAASSLSLSRMLLALSPLLLAPHVRTKEKKSLAWPLRACTKKKKSLAYPLRGALKEKKSHSWISRQPQASKLNTRVQSM